MPRSLKDELPALKRNSTNLTKSLDKNPTLGTNEKKLIHLLINSLVICLNQIQTELDNLKGGSR